MDLSGNSAYRQIFHIIREIGVTESKLLTIRLCVDVLRFRHSTKCVQILQSKGYDYRFDPTDKEGYRRDLELVLKKTKSLEFALIRLRQEYQTLSKDNIPKEITREDFEMSIAVLSTYLHFPLIPKQTTVGMYLTYSKLYRKEVELANKQREDIKAKRPVTPNKLQRNG